MPTSEAVIASMVEQQREYFDTGATRLLSSRLKLLRQLQACIREKEEDIHEALYKDLHKSPEEAYLTETGIVLHELRRMIKHLPSYAKSKRVRTGLGQLPGTSFLSPEPYGVTLIMSPWNYPFQLTMVPLIGALAAGNCAVLKPSNDAKHTAGVITDIVQSVFQPEHVTVVQGGRDENTQLLAQRFDYIFFTGSVQVGKVVMQAAAGHLTPLTLELGGKSPVIVDETADLALAARRIAFGKLLNAGQTCVAPDYLLVQDSVREQLITMLKQEITTMTGQADALAHIVSDKHAARLRRLLANETKVWGGLTKGLRMHPALVELDALDSPLMQEEIFGPILPVLSVRNLEEAIQVVKTFEKPLALYLFSRQKENQKLVLNSLSFGGGCINDTVLHYSNIHLPFGGVGHSGMGSYHGKRSFDTFSHFRGILKKHPWPDITARYLPYTGLKKKLVRMILK